MEDLKKENIIEEAVEDTTVIDLYPTDESSETESHGIGKLVFGLGLAAVGATVALAVKNKDKIKQKKLEKKIKELEDAGYRVYEAEDFDDFEEELEDDVPECETEEETEE